MTHRNACGHQIALVKDENEVLMWCLLPDVFFYRLASCPNRVSAIQDMNNDI